jgi:hypothetical protein
MLTQDQIDFYQENGYLLVKNVFSKQEAAAFRKEAHELIAPAFGIAQCRCHLGQRPRPLGRRQENPALPLSQCAVSFGAAGWNHVRSPASSTQPPT